MEAIKTTNLTKYYGKSRGIIDLNLTVERGEFFGFIGPNGAGKSTTIRTLLGLISPSNGEGAVLGHDIVKENQKILKKVGYLPAESIFYSGMKVKDVLKFSADLRKTNCNAEAKLLCDRLHLDINKKVDELSFGNRKKVAIVCALQHKPELLILDEPTSGLDPLMQKEFFDILKGRNAEGATIFLSSHVLSEIQRNCSRAAIIREGKLIACDTVEALAKTNAKRVIIHGNINIEAFQNMKDIKQQDGEISFLYSGNINSLVQKLSKADLEDLSITEPDLEEIVMHYYTEGGAE